MLTTSSDFQRFLRYSLGIELNLRWAQPHSISYSRIWIGVYWNRVKQRAILFKIIDYIPRILESIIRHSQCFRFHLQFEPTNTSFTLWLHQFEQRSLTLISEIRNFCWSSSVGRFITFKDFFFRVYTWLCFLLVSRDKGREVRCSRHAESPRKIEWYI
jgi:hypothetical protein